MAARVVRCAAAVLLSTLLLGACGGGDEESDAGQASAAPTTGQEEPSSTPSQAPGPAGDEGGDDAGEEGQIYVVRSGDTLSTIAQRFDTTVQAIVRANDISDPDVIDIGQRPRIPGG